MSDMFSIGANAIQLYRHSLTTVSNNIANLNTEGYSRQVTDVSESAPVEKGNIFLGTGARLEGVVRAYDEYTESSLRNSNSDLETQQPQVKYANRIIDLMGSDTAAASEVNHNLSVGLLGHVNSRNSRHITQKGVPCVEEPWRLFCSITFSS